MYFYEDNILESILSRSIKLFINIKQNIRTKRFRSIQILKRLVFKQYHKMKLCNITYFNYFNKCTQSLLLFCVRFNVIRWVTMVQIVLSQVVNVRSIFK